MKCPRCGMDIEAFEVAMLTGKPSTLDIELVPCHHIVGVEEKNWPEPWKRIHRELAAANRERVEEGVC